MSGNIVFKQEQIMFTVGTFETEAIEFSLGTNIWSSQQNQHEIFFSASENLENVSFLLFDQNGRLLSETKSDLASGVNELNLIANLVSGIHYLSVVYKGDLYSQKLIVE